MFLDGFIILSVSILLTIIWKQPFAAYLCTGRINLQAKGVLVTSNSHALFTELELIN